MNYGRLHWHRMVLLMRVLLWIGGTASVDWGTAGVRGRSIVGWWRLGMGICTLLGLVVRHLVIRVRWHRRYVALLLVVHSYFACFVVYKVSQNLTWVGALAMCRKTVLNGLLCG